MNKYRFELKVQITVTVEAKSKGEAQKIVLRELDSHVYDSRLREECLIDEGYGV